MEVVDLVDRPNIGLLETTLCANGSYSRHNSCRVYWTMKRQKGLEIPLLVRVEAGPIRCALCGRRASQKLARIIRRDFRNHAYSSVVKGKKVNINIFTFLRDDIPPDTASWRVLRILTGE